MEVLWPLTGVGINIWAYGALTKGKWDGPAIPLCILTCVPAALLGPLIGIVYAICFWLMERENAH
jgi:hypothetical protein